MRLKFISIFILFGLFVNLSACGERIDYPEAPVYIGHPDGEFPIGATYALYHPYMTDQQMEWVKEAGFNTVSKMLNTHDTDTLIRLADKYGMAVLVANRAIRDPKLAKSTIDHYRNRDGVWGYIVCDEPHTSEFAYFASIDSTLKTNDPGKLRLHNLLPAVSSKQLGAKDYKAYVDGFVMTVNPSLLMLDIYPVKQDKKGNIFVEPILYRTMEVIREVAAASDRPFWSFLPSIASSEYPKLTREYLRFSAFMALAYGAQGFLYFTYLPPDFDKEKREFSHSPIDWEGKRTDVWYVVRDINKEIRNLENVFLGAKVLDVSQTGMKIPEATKRLEKLPSPFLNIESDGEGVTVSHFRNGKDEYLLLVNRDVLHKQKVRLSRIRPVIRIYGDGKQKVDKGNSLTLSPGGYALFKM